MALKMRLSPNHIEFLKLLQKSSRDNHGKFCLSCYDKNWNHPCQLFNANPFKLFQYVDSSHNFYLSENQFSRNQRSTNSVEDLDNIFCDCDCLKYGIPLQKFLNQLPYILKLAHLPQPCVKFSGHGFHLVYVINQIICRAKTRKGANLIQYWQNTEEFVINKINQACLQTFHKSPVDLAVHDTSRVLRLADTNNVKAKPVHSYWVSIAKHIYQLRDFWSGRKKYPKLYNYYRHNFRFTHKKTYKYKFKNTTNHRQHFHHYIHKGKMTPAQEKRLGNSRMNWLISAFYNQLNQHLQGRRDLFLFILAREATKVYTNKDKVVKLLYYINNQIKPYPLEVKGLDKIINEVKNNYANARIKKYNYTTTFICKLLHIHPIYSHTKAIHRRNIKKIHQDKKQQQDEYMYKQIKGYRQHHQSYSAIARQFHCSRHYLSNVIKRHKKYQQKEQSVTQQNQHLNLSHFCPRRNTVESHEDNSKNLKTYLDTPSYKNINGVDREQQQNIPRVKISNYIQSRRYQEYEKQAMPAIIKNHIKHSQYYGGSNYRNYRSKSNRRKYTREQIRKYDAQKGYQRVGQSVLSSNRKLFKLYQWLNNGNYRSYGFTRQQIYRLIKCFKN